MRKQVWQYVALVMILSAMFLTASCAQKKVTQAEPVSEPEQEVREVVTNEPAEDIGQEKKLPQETAIQAVEEKTFDNENIYFAFDSADLSDKARLILSNNADYLRRHSSLTLTVEGHCDERGSKDYNNALGRRRAESVKKFLVNQGISYDRLVTVSYGENKPAALGRDEASWAKNRRAQLVVNLASAASKSLKN